MMLLQVGRSTGFWNIILFDRTSIGIIPSHVGWLPPSILFCWLQYRPIVYLYHNSHAKHKHWGWGQANLKQEEWTEGVDSLDGNNNITNLTKEVNTMDQLTHTITSADSSNDLAIGWHSDLFCWLFDGRILLDTISYEICWCYSVSSRLGILH